MNADLTEFHFAPMNKITDLKCRILVVEDNIDIATLLLDYLADLGHVPDHAADGHEAYHLWEIEGLDEIVICAKIKSPEFVL